MQRNYIILVVLLVVIVLGGLGYYAFNQYNISKTQEYLKSSENLKNNATIYFDQAAAYEKSGDYSRAIQAYQNSSDKITKALFKDKQALSTASGVYHEYLDVDIQLLEKTAKLLEYKVYQNQYLNNSLNVGQEKVNPSVLIPYINNLNSEIADLKDKQDQIIKNNIAAFEFLN
jgi:uncharacterized protein YxeA